MKRKLNTLINSNFEKLQFGDFILFQEYKYKNDGGVRNFYITKPIYAIYLGLFVADQTIGFNYVIHINDNHMVKITNKYVENFSVIKEVGDIKAHIEWDDHIDILGSWKYRPNWKEIMLAYRNQNLNNVILEKDVDY